MAAVASVLLVGAPALAASTGSAAVAKGPEGIALINAPDLAPASTTVNGTPVDGIQCVTESEENVNFHTHTLVRIFVKGHERRLPAGLGITAPKLQEHLSTGLFDDVGVHDCLYWVHVHANDGIVHVEAPAAGTFTLGQLFDEWRQPLTTEAVGPATGPVTVFVDGKKWSGAPGDAVLQDKSTIVLDVGKPVVNPPTATFKVKGLCGAGTTSCSPKAS